ncbi:MAG: flagellar export chaperone FliS [Bdellovibrionaceae bacterium]|nr:flagellar export chaperone FliS [Pseudobdellovibrionaceae bacterium]MBX3032832.1 flagellar export chaperone FliS [Pseudobdellovibrionaceae bacterium]
MTNPYQKYKQTAVQSASREKILLMLYEGAIKFTKLGIKACEEKKIADRGQNIGRAYDIIMELNNTLDHKVGGDIAKNLEQLYMYIMEEFTKANISGKPEHLHNALKIMENLYQGWLGAIEKLKKEQDSQGNKGSV